MLHEDDVALLFESFTQANKTKKMTSLDVRILNLHQTNSPHNENYTYFHICIKLINSNNKFDVFLTTFEKLDC